ncbi:hypothetical protein AB0J63_49425 [Streptosporangium canum]|uniref:hypothetical protein n=1 Tax=Streptosporangium canum TaxID=324952 RepID=UPI00343704D7
MITMNSRTRRMSLLAAVALVALVPQAAFPDTQPKVPVAQAFDGDKPLPSVKPVIERCEAQPGDCRFEIDKAAFIQFRSVVRSLGNAVINCTGGPIRVMREVTLTTGSTDNLGGEITGKISVEGQVNVSGEVTAGVSGEANAEFKTPNMQQGPSATAGVKGGANGSGKLAGSLGVKGAFEGAFTGKYQHEWKREHSEKTTFEVSVASGDALTFAASSAMQRVGGNLSVGGGLGVRNIVVDGPSTINTSTFTASTFTVPGSTCQRVRSTGQNAVDDTLNTLHPARLARHPGFLTVIPALPRGARLKERIVLTPERS